MGREHHRIPVDFYVNKVIDGVPYLARARDLSVGGMYLDRLLEPRTRDGSRMGIEFALPGESETQFKALLSMWKRVEADDLPGYFF